MSDVSSFFVGMLNSKLLINFILFIYLILMKKKLINNLQINEMYSNLLFDKTDITKNTFIIVAAWKIILNRSEIQDISSMIVLSIIF